MQRERPSLLNPHPSGRVIVEHSMHHCANPHFEAPQGRRALAAQQEKAEPPLGPLQCAFPPSGVRRDHAFAPVATAPLRHRDPQHPAAAPIVRIGPPRRECVWDVPLSRIGSLHYPDELPLQPLRNGALTAPDAEAEAGAEALMHGGGLQHLRPLAGVSASLRPPPEVKHPNIPHGAPITTLRNGGGGGTTRSAVVPKEEGVVGLAAEDEEGTVREASTAASLRHLFLRDAKRDAAARARAEGGTAHVGGSAESPRGGESLLTAKDGSGGGTPLMLLDPAMIPVKNPITTEALMAPFRQTRRRVLVKKRPTGNSAHEGFQRGLTQSTGDGGGSRGHARVSHTVAVKLAADSSASGGGMSGNPHHWH